MTDEQLQEWVEYISERDFGIPFKHKATFNRRLRATGGRYFTKTHNIDISWLQYVEFGPDEVEKIIKHELCHYHLHLGKKGYKHRDPEFNALLAKVGGSRYCQRLPDTKRRVEPYRYIVKCTNCDQQFRRKRKVDVRKYACGICRGKLTLKAL